MVTKKKTRHSRPIRSGNHSTAGEKFAERLHSGFSAIFSAKRATATVVGVLAAITVIIGALLWYNKSYTDPKNVFYSMLNNNLNTNSITREVGQEGAGGSSQEIIQIAFSPQPVVRDIRNVTSQGTSGEAHVKIESIGTDKDTYQHYLMIEQPGKDSSTYKKVYPMWIKNGNGQQASNAQLFTDAMFGALLFGKLQPEARANILAQLERGYKVDFSKVKKEKIDGRNCYIYDAKIALPDYARAAKSYAKSLGLPNSNQINPDNYKQTDQLELSVSVDVLSRQIKKVSYTGSGQTEKYSGYGILAEVAPPNKTVEYTTLQKTISEASK